MPAGSGRYPSGQRGQTVNLLADAFGGSNPPLPTIDSFGRSVLGVGGQISAGRGSVDQDRCNDIRGNSSAVERQPSKLGVAGSNPVSRSRLQCELSRVPRGETSGEMIETPSAHVAQMAERVLGKDEVSGSIPDMGSSSMQARIRTVHGR